MSDSSEDVMNFFEEKLDIISEGMKFTKEQSELINETIDEIYENNFPTTTMVGEVLERLTSQIFGLHKIYKVKRNLRTRTNEIDLFIELDKKGKFLNSNLYNSLEKVFLVECKNYTDRVGVTYVGKFSSLMGVSRVKSGIFISKNGLTGNSERWSDSKGLIKKLALRDSTFILDFELSDFKDLEGRTLEELLSAKLNALKLDVSFDSLIEHHELESEI